MAGFPQPITKRVASETEIKTKTEFQKVRQNSKVTSKMAQTAEEVGNAIMQRHDKHLTNFMAYASSVGLPKFEELLTNPEALDTALVNYFDHLIESGQFEMNFSSLLVDLRSVLFTKSGQSIDIQIAHEFPKTSEFRCLLVMFNFDLLHDSFVH